ncbi:MAG: hypothetical protein LBD23_17555 [Oscillospiraceae bacterium]|jgi:hypothetical protein|nr:hypothetical protein [Oscillospiraceae bacterium]
MIKQLKRKGKLIVGIYIILTIIKLFTANIYRDFAEENPTFYIKLRPTFANTFQGSERAMEHYNGKYTWYEQRQYWKIFHTNGSYIFAGIYNILIITWWIMSAGFIIFGIYKLLKS